MSSVDRINGLTGDLAIKTPVRVATTANITLSGLQTIDGVSLAAGDRVLVKNQTDAVDNGIWTASTSSWSRALDFDGSYDCVQGTLVSVTSGTVNEQTVWQLTTANPVIGTSSLTFERGAFSDAANMAADDGASGSLWTTVQGFINKVISSAGSAVMGFIQAGAGAVASTVQAELRLRVNAKQFGATGLGAVSDNVAIQAATDAHERVYLPPGTYLAHRISVPAGHVLYGAGEKTIIKRDYYVGAVETALTILADNSQLRNLVIDGNKAAAPAAWGTGTYIQGVSGPVVDGVKYTNCKRDGLFALDADDFTLANITTESNDRAGVAITGNCHGFDISHIRSTGDTVAGLDLEPDTASSENTNFRVSDVLVDGTLFSVQGLSTSIINRGGAVNNIVARNAGVIRFNKFDDLAVSGISCDSTSEFRIEDSYPTVYGRGVGEFNAVALAGLAGDGVNQVAEPHFTSMTSLWWTSTLSGGGSTIAHTNDAQLGKFCPVISVAGGAAGNFAFYISPSITVAANEFVSLGGRLKAITGRPYIEIQYRAGAVVLDTYRAAWGVTADGVWRNFLKFTKTPATCDNIRFLIGGAYDNVGDFSGAFDGIYLYRNAFKTDAGPVDKTLRANKAYDPANLADGVGVTTTVTCTGAALGDRTTATFSLDLQGVTLNSWVSAANTVSTRFQNESGGPIDLANGVLAVSVLR